MDRKRAFIWKAFTTEDCEPKYAKCLYCDAMISRGDVDPRKQTNTNLKNHVKKSHPEDWNKLNEEDEAAKNNGN